MEEFKIFEKKRRIKQFFMGIVFLAILIGGWFYPLLGYFIPLCMFLGIGVGLWRGRKWCDWYCPRGSFNDTLLKVIPNVATLWCMASGSRRDVEAGASFGISLKRDIPRFFKGLPLRIGFLFFLMAMMTIQIIKRWPDPYKIGMFFVILLTVTTILAIILALVFHQRTWCCFCPIGSLGNWVGRGKYPLKIDSKLCTECKLCYKVCPIQVGAYRYKKDSVEIVKDGDCLKCQMCVTACPKKALTF